MVAGRPLTLATETLVDVLVAAGIVFAVAFALGMAANVAASAHHPLLPLASVSGSLLAGLAVWAWRRESLPASRRRASRADWGLSILGAFGLQAIAIGYGWAAAVLGRDSLGSNIGPVLAAYAAAPMMTLLFAVVVAPLGEELLFRRVLLHRFALGGRPGLGLAVTSLGFALIHEPVPGDRGVGLWLLKLAPYVLMGLGFGALYLRTARFGPVLLCHMLVNATGLGLLFTGR